MRSTSGSTPRCVLVLDDVWKSEPTQAGGVRYVQTRKSAPLFFDVARAAGLRVRRINAATRSLELQAMLVASRNTFILRAARSVPRRCTFFSQFSGHFSQVSGRRPSKGRQRVSQWPASSLYRTCDCHQRRRRNRRRLLWCCLPDRALDRSRRLCPSKFHLLPGLSSVVNDRGVKVIKVGYRRCVVS